MIKMVETWFECISANPIGGFCPNLHCCEMTFYDLDTIFMVSGYVRMKTSDQKCLSTDQSSLL